MTCGKIGATRNFALEFDIKDSNFFNSLRGEEGKEGILEIEGRHSRNLSFAVCIRFTFQVFLPAIHRQ